MKWSIALAGLTGCYMEAGLGGGGGVGTVHGSVGLIVHLGEGGSVHAGGGAAYGPYRPSSGTNGSVLVAPVAVGADVVIVGRGPHQLVASTEWDLPVLGRIYPDGGGASVSVLTAHGILGPGYRHLFLAPPEPSTPEDPNPAPREKGSLSISVGPELWYTASDSGAHTSSATTFGVAGTILVEARAWAIAHWFDCFSNKHGTCED